MSVALLACYLLVAFAMGWHTRDAVNAPPDWDATAARRLARRLWKRRRKA